MNGAVGLPSPSVSLEIIFTVPLAPSSASGDALLSSSLAAGVSFTEVTTKVIVAEVVVQTPVGSHKLYGSVAVPL
ncbi:hypothetical protein MCETHM1_03383 [Flavobacteriaceae bacterium]